MEPVNWAWNASYWAPLTALSTLTAGFLIYLVIYLSEGLQHRLKARFGEIDGVMYWVVIGKLAGFVLLGVIPALIILFYLKMDLADFGAGPVNHTGTWWWMLIGGGLIILLNVLQGRRPKHYAVYPLIRHQDWNLKLFLTSVTTSVLFIVGYEFMFRGFLLFACLPLMGPFVAIALNVLIYALAHIHKGLGETIGSVPFGILLCWITLYTGNFWAILVMHLMLTLTADFVGLYFNPDMHLRWKWK